MTTGETFTCPVCNRATGDVYVPTPPRHRMEDGTLRRMCKACSLSLYRTAVPIDQLPAALRQPPDSHEHQSTATHPGEWTDRR